MRRLRTQGDCRDGSAEEEGVWLRAVTKLGTRCLLRSSLGARGGGGGGGCATRWGGTTVPRSPETGQKGGWKATIRRSAERRCKEGKEGVGRPENWRRKRAPAVPSRALQVALAIMCVVLGAGDASCQPQPDGCAAFACAFSAARMRSVAASPRPDSRWQAGISSIASCRPTCTGGGGGGGAARVRQVGGPGGERRRGVYTRGLQLASKQQWWRW